MEEHHTDLGARLAKGGGDACGEIVLADADGAGQTTLSLSVPWQRSHERSRVSLVMHPLLPPLPPLQPWPSSLL